jgi:hypothetical protein
MNRIQRRSGLAIMAVIGVLAALPALSVAAGGFKLGSYSGKTSQHYKIAFRLVHAPGCPGRNPTLATYCLSTKTQAYLALKCPDGTGSNNYIDILGRLNKAGVLKGTSHGSNEIVNQIYVKVTRKGTISGWVKFVQAESIEGTGPTCSSGKVTFSAKHV